MSDPVKYTISLNGKPAGWAVLMDPLRSDPAPCPTCHDGGTVDIRVRETERHRCADCAETGLQTYYAFTEGARPVQQTRPCFSCGGKGFHRVIRKAQIYFVPGFQIPCPDCRRIPVSQEQP
jgi:hypothetical protein